MPSWKKVILSGSDAALNSLNVTTSITASTVSASNGFTGSLLGTASLASTASSIFIDSTTLPGPFPVLFELTSGRISKDSGSTDFSYNPNTNTLNVNNILGTASWAQSASNAVNARTASFVNNLNQNLSITGAVVLSGSSQPELRVIGETQFTGSVNSLNGYTGSLFGTASWANTASVALNLPPGTYGITSSWARNSLTSSLALLSSHSWTITDGTNSEVIGYNTAVTFSGGGGTTVGYNPTRNELSITSTDYTAGTALDLTAGVFDVDLTELTNSTTITSSNSFVIVSGSNQRLISASLIGLNIFNNNLTLFNSPITASIISASGGITGSLLGTSSWAQNSSTSSISSFVTIDSVSLPGPFPILFESATGRVSKDSGSVDFGFSPANNVLIVGTVSASSGFTGSLFGTASWAQSASNTIWAQSSSNAISSSFSNLVNISNNSINRILTAEGPGNVINAESNFTFTGTDLFLTGGYSQKGDMTVVNSIGTAFRLTKETLGSTVAELGDLDNGSNGTILVVDDTNRLIGIKFDNGTVSHVFDSTQLNLQGNLIAGVDESSFHVITGSAEIRGDLSVTNTTQTAKLTGSFISNDGNNRVVTSDGDGTFTAESGLTYTPGLLNISGSTNITGSLTVTGTGSFNTVNAQVLNVTYVSSSVVYSSGSNTFGSSSANTQTLIGNVVVTGSSFTWNNSTVITSAVTSSMSVLSASYASSSTSASYALNATSASYALTSSIATRNILTASNEYSEITFTKGDGSTFLIDTAPQKVVETVINKEATTLPKGTPVYVSGSTGNASHVYKADAGNSAKMPAAYVLNESLDTDAEGVALLSGFINGVDTSTFQAGQSVYVAVGGGYTNIKPTGSALIQKLGNVISVGVNGSGVITGAGRTNDIPNITTDYLWVGNADQVPTAVSTASLRPLTSSYATTASYVLNAVSASHALTASYVNPLTQSVFISEGLRVSKSDYGLIIGTQYASSSVSGNLEFVSRKLTSGETIYDSSLIIRPAGNIQGFGVDNGLYLRHNGYSSSIGTTPYNPLYFTTGNTLTSFGTIRGGILFNGKVFFGPSSFIGNESGISMSADFEVGLTANFRKDTKITGSDANPNTYALRVTNTNGPDIFTIRNDRKVGINFNTASLNESLNVSGNIKIENGYLIGTSSWATSSLTASYVLNAVSSSFASTASYVNPLTQSVFISEGLRVSKSDYGLIIGTEYASSSVSGNLEFVSNKFTGGSNIYDSSLIIRPAGNTQGFGTNNALWIRYNGYSASIGTSTSSPIYFTTDNTLTSFGIVRGGILSNGKVFFGDSNIIGNNGGISMSADFEVGLTANFRKDTKITGSNSSANNYALRVTNTSGTDIFTIANNRKVGINFNTASLNESLNVSGNIKIEDGSLIGTASWAVSASNVLTASYVLNAISSSFASTASFVRNAQTASYVNPLTQSVLITGSLSVTGSTSITSGTLSVYKSSSTVVDVQGSQGSLLRVTDILSGSLFSVGDISGLPILEVFSDDTVIAGGYNQYDLIVTESKVGIGTSNPTDKLTVSGSVNSVTQILTASLYRSESANLITIGTSSGLDIYETGFVKINTKFTSNLSNTVNIFKIHPSASYISTINVLTFTSASNKIRYGFHFGKAVYMNEANQQVGPAVGTIPPVDSNDLTYLTYNVAGGNESADIALSLTGLGASVSNGTYFIRNIIQNPHPNIQNYSCSIHVKYEIFKT